MRIGILEEYDIDDNAMRYTLMLDEDGWENVGEFMEVAAAKMNPEQLAYACKCTLEHLDQKGIGASMPEDPLTAQSLRTLRAHDSELNPDAAPRHLYIRLEKPNNEYDADGKLVFESSLNMSANFDIFVLNPKFAEFKSEAYLEIKVDFSPAKKFLVNKLSLRIIAKSDEIASAIGYKIKEITGERAEYFVHRKPEFAWRMLNKLVSAPLSYGCIWTDKQYTPTTPKEENEFKVEYREDKRSWTFSPAGWADPIFEVRIDEWGRPIFSYRPDNSGYPATMECLLSDARRLLGNLHNVPGQWLLNTIIPEALLRSCVK